MFKTKPQAAAMLATVSAVIIVGLLMVFGGKGQAEQNNPQGRAMTNQSPSEPTAKELDDLATPIVDLNDSSPINGDRILKNARYDKRPLVRTQIDPGVVEVRVYDSVSISDIPTDESDLVVEGKITSAAAFLSNDKGMVYSEFSVQVTEILKAPSGLAAVPNLIVADRPGGRVRYPDGRIIRYRIAGRGSPEKAKRYLFFLSGSGRGNYTLLTAYELNGNKVLALDGSRLNSRGLGRSVFDKHTNEDYHKFRTAVETAIKNPRSGAGTRRSGP